MLTVTSLVWWLWFQQGDEIPWNRFHFPWRWTSQWADKCALYYCTLWFPPLETCQWQSCAERVLNLQFINLIMNIWLTLFWNTFIEAQGPGLAHMCRSEVWAVMIAMYSLQANWPAGIWPVASGPFFPPWVVKSAHSSTWSKTMKWCGTRYSVFSA